MIRSWAYDVEIFPNLFSITFVNLQDYLKVFADCGTNALTDKYKVSEIKDKLETVESRIFYISDTDDSQLLKLVSFINDMEARFDDKGNPIRYDLFGYNNQAYDDMMIKAFLMNFNRYDSSASLIKYLYELSKKLISMQDDKSALWADKELDYIRKYRLPYATVDLFKVYALNSAGVNIDKDGNRNKFGKSLKMVSINLKWHELLDFTLPPINEEEAEFYRKNPNYRGFSIEQLNVLFTNDFDRYVLPKYVEPMLHYNKNDVYIVCEIARQKPEEIKLRYSLGHAFNLNLLCSARSNIADKLLYKFYSEMSGLKVEAFKKLRTERTRLSFNKIIFPHICFKTKQLQDILADMKQIYIYHTNKDAFCKEFTFYGTTYTLATGGLHSQDRPDELKSVEGKYTYIHYDISSFYPSVMVAYNIAPKHLNQRIFTKMVDYFRVTRIKCKHTADEVEQFIKGVHNKLSAEALKIVINAIYGKFGFQDYFLYDRFAQMQVTINGQLMVMMVIEALELNGIHVVSANTDGIIVKLPADKEEDFKRITDEWCAQNKLSADSERYKLFVARDINNYVNKQDNDKLEYKGALDPKQYIKDLKKGYDMPIVAKAVCDYFLNGTPVIETLKSHNNILDFCKTQNVGKQFDVVYDRVINGEVKTIESQRHVRFYVSLNGVIIYKKHKTTGAKSVLASGLPVTILNSLDDKSIEERGIDYKYYYNEAYKIINPIKLGISPNRKGDSNKKLLSGKVMLKRNFGLYNSLFDDETSE